MAERKQQVALNGAPVFLDMKREYTRDGRSNAKDYYNMLLEQPVIDNELRPERWQKNGFQGHVQYIPYVGRSEIRPGEKLVRDIQVPTFPKEMSRPLNRTQMARATVQIRDFASEKNNTGHEEYMATMKGNQKEATKREFSENPYVYSVDIRQRTKEYDNLDSTLRARMSDVRPAGLASINPTLGTVGVTANLVGNVKASLICKCNSYLPSHTHFQMIWWVEGLLLLLILTLSNHLSGGRGGGHIDKINGRLHCPTA
ncbi:unnamed protein product [Amoebophrya sp. A25]|nr:unnamed protein product [Amoebophrya sp. A25]|eukprot:GSA25T00027149001.1